MISFKTTPGSHLSSRSPLMDFDDCAVCREPLADRADRWRPLRCEHWFHKECITSWLLQRPRCAVCSGEASSIINFVTRDTFTPGGSGWPSAAQFLVDMANAACIVIVITYMVFFGGLGFLLLRLIVAWNTIVMPAFDILVCSLIDVMMFLVGSRRPAFCDH